MTDKVPETNAPKGFWDGGKPGHRNNREASGRASGLPGTRRTRRIGVRTDVDFPPEETVNAQR